MLLVLLACHAPAPSIPDRATGTAAAETYAPGSPVEALEVALGEVPTVLHVRWRTSMPSVSTVTGTLGDEQIVVTETTASTEHDVVLAGFPARAAVTVAVDVLDEEGVDAETTVTTGALPAWVPDLTFTADVPEAAAGGFTVAALIDLTGGAPLIVDGAGRPVWAQDRVTQGAITRARLSLDGAAVLYNGLPYSVDRPGTLTRVPLDGGAAETISVNGIHTDFVELPSGGYAALGWDLRTFGDRQILGTTIVEIEPDGASRVVWSVFDDFMPDLGFTYPSGYAADDTVEDWSHINGLFYDAAEDDYYVTMTWIDGVARVDRGTGELVWTVSRHGGDFATVGAPVLEQPHSVQRTAEGLLVFNRGYPQDRDTCSEAVELVLDEAAGTVTNTMQHRSDRCLLVTYLGSAARLDGGNTLVSWSTAGQMDELTPEGELAWQVSAPVGAAFGFAERVARLGGE
ncbi:MAG: aryl-sulfate sulfotransferase [Myxococcota bacterium]